eukprot:830492_1
MSRIICVISCMVLTYLVSTSGKITPSQVSQLKSDITSLIKEKNCAPILVRLAWHDSGTYDKVSKTGGPRAAQRFDSGESTHGANAGLDVARNLLSPLAVKYCDTNIISIADLWTFAGNTAIHVSSGPDIPFRFGRNDISDASECVEDGRLPDAAQGTKHVRNVLGRIGFKNDKYIVALSGAHTLGSCHVDRSGYEGPWTDDPHTFDNSYFKDLAFKPWDIDVSGAGLTQFINDDGGRTIMLPSDWSLMADRKTKEIVEQYANDQALFFKDFSVAWKRLIEAGYSDDTLYA